LSKSLEGILFRLTKRRERALPPPPLLIELLGRVRPDAGFTYESYPFSYQLTRRERTQVYTVGCDLGTIQLAMLRKAVAEASSSLEPREVNPLTFARLVQVLSQLVAEHIDRTAPGTRVKELAELGAYEAIGLSRVYALARDERVTEFFVDSEASPIYLDHTLAGRCETSMLLTARERSAIETHLDTFRGYTLDSVSYTHLTLPTICSV